MGTADRLVLVCNEQWRLVAVTPPVTGPLASCAPALDLDVAALFDRPLSLDQPAMSCRFRLGARPWAEVRVTIEAWWVTPFVRLSVTAIGDGERS